MPFFIQNWVWRIKEKRQQTQQELRQWDLFHDPRAFAARIRAELHQMVRDLAQEEYEEAASGLVSDPLAEVVWDVENSRGSIQNPTARNTAK